MIVKIGMIVMINIDIRDKLVIIIPLGAIIVLNSPVEFMEIEIIKEINKILKMIRVKMIKIELKEKLEKLE